MVSEPGAGSLKVSKKLKEGFFCYNNFSSRVKSQEKESKLFLNLFIFVAVEGS